MTEAETTIEPPLSPAIQRVVDAKELRDQDIEVASAAANEYLMEEIKKARQSDESMAAIAEALEWSRTYIYQFMRENR